MRRERFAACGPTTTSSWVATATNVLEPSSSGPNSGRDKYGAHASAFVESVHSIAIRINPPAWYAIDRNADRPRKTPSVAAANVCGTSGTPGKYSRPAHRPDRLIWDRATAAWLDGGLGHHRDFDTGIAAAAL